MGLEMEVREVEQLFMRSDGSYLCARWGRAIVPVVFGVEESAIGVLKGAIEAVCAMVGHPMAPSDPELGVNLMMFFCRDWDELRGVPDLDRLVPELGDLVTRLIRVDASQYRIFRFDEAGAIRACFVFLRMDSKLAALPAETLALSQAVQAMISWSDQAFAAQSPLALVRGHAVLRPEIADVIRAVYDSAMPVMGRDASHALRIFARLSAPQETAL